MPPAQVSRLGVVKILHYPYPINFNLFKLDEQKKEQN